MDTIAAEGFAGSDEIRGFGAKRALPHFDDLLVLGASVSRYPLEGYREACSTETVGGIEALYGYLALGYTTLSVTQLPAIDLSVRGNGWSLLFSVTTGQDGRVLRVQLQSSSVRAWRRRVRRQR